MPESEDHDRIERLINERDTLRVLAKIQIETLKRQVQSLHPASLSGEDGFRAQPRNGNGTKSQNEMASEVLHLLGNGLSIRHIAKELHISRSKVGRIKKKWNSRGTGQVQV